MQYNLHPILRVPSLYIKEELNRIKKTQMNKLEKTKITFLETQKVKKSTTSWIKCHFPKILLITRYQR